MDDSDKYERSRRAAAAGPWIEAEVEARIDTKLSNLERLAKDRNEVDSRSVWVLVGEIVELRELRRKVRRDLEQGTEALEVMYGSGK